MKTIFLSLLLLISTLSIAQKETCTVYFKDGTTLEGLGDFKVDGDFKFKTDEKSEKQTFAKETIDKVRMGEPGNYSTFRYKIVRDTETGKWLRELVVGEVSLYAHFTSGAMTPMMGMSTGGSGMSGGMTFGGGSDVTYYYVCHKGEADVFTITSIGNISKNFKKTASEYFKDCPSLVEKIQTKVYKKENIVQIVNIYNLDCGKK